MWGRWLARTVGLTVCVGHCRALVIPALPTYKGALGQPFSCGPGLRPARSLRRWSGRAVPSAHLFHDHTHDHKHGAAVTLGKEPGAAADVQGPGDGHGHSHAHFHVDLKEMKSKKTLTRLFIASLCVLALPLWRRSSRTEFLAVGGVALFLGVVDACKVVIKQLRVHFSELYTGWRRHSPGSQAHAELAAAKVEAANEVDAVTWAGVGVNVVLAGFKFVAGILGNSAAMIADAGHSLSDLLSDGVTLWAVRLSRLPPDDDHPYGHGRFEAVGALIISVMLLAAGYGIGNHSYESLCGVLAATAAAAHGGAVAAAPPLPGRLAVVAALVSIVFKEALYQVTARVGKRQNSQVLIANAWHHRSDAVSSVVALVAIGGAMMGAPLLDPVAGLMVAGMVALTGVHVCSESLKQLTDTVDYDVRRQVASVAREVEGVVSFDRIRARQMGPETLVDLTIQTDTMISASAAQQVAARTRWSILEAVPTVSDVLVNIAVDEKPCPVMNSLRPQGDIEQDIRSVLRKELPEIEGVSKIMVHYIAMVTTAEVFVHVDPKLRVYEVTDIARRAKRALQRGVYDLCSAEVHLDLVEAY